MPAKGSCKERGLTSKTCRVCLVEKPIGEFYQQTGKEVRKNQCRTCYVSTLNKDVRRRWYHENADGIREQARVNARRWRAEKKANDPVWFSLWQRLNVSRKAAKAHGHRPCAATIEELRATYTNICGCCGVVTKRIVLDHCHKTGKFRGWLCNGCNSLLGHAKDDKQVLKLAIEYLTKNESDATATVCPNTQTSSP